MATREDKTALKIDATAAQTADSREDAAVVDIAAHMEAVGEMRGALLERLGEWRRSQMDLAADANSRFARATRDCAAAPSPQKLHAAQIDYAQSLFSHALAHHQLCLRLALDVAQIMVDAAAQRRPLQD